MNNTYNTKQKKIILSFFLKNRDEMFTCDDIYGLLKLSGTPVGKSTVYRFLEKLTEKGQIRKIKDNSGKSALYQYIDEGLNCDSHLHLKCLSCGKFIHLGCEFMNGINEHISAHHSFRVDYSKTVIYGVCSDCSGQ